MEQCDVAVIGSGPAGMLAAARAAQRGRRVVLLEKNAKAGVKVLMSGGTRCNLTHATDAAGIAAAFGREQGAFLRSALSRLDPEGVVVMFRAAGVATKIEPGGKVFPESDSAVDVQRALVAMLAASGAELRLRTAALGITRGNAGFVVATPRGELQAERVILTVGGQSYPECGTTGDGYAWAKALGHRIVPPRPALTPLLSPAPWIAQLRGVTVPDVAVTMASSNDDASGPNEGSARSKRTRNSAGQTVRGSFLFTHFGLSGPAPMNASGVISAKPQAGAWTAVCDFLPAISGRDLEAELVATAQSDGKRSLATWLAERLPRHLVDALLAEANVPGERRLAELSRQERTGALVAVKRTAIPISGTQGFKKAEVTAGGVDLREVDSRTMESKLVPGLFFAGEVLDLDGPIGGYNFQAAFSTGALAGESC